MTASHVSSHHHQQRSSYVGNTTVGRSKPIAIQNHHLAMEEAAREQEQEAQERQFYEGTTWRMYQRIVYHRLNTPPQPTSPLLENCSGWESPQGVNSAGSPTPQLVRPKPRYARANAPIIPDFPPASMYNNDPVYDMEGLEDEVFDFEL